MDEVVRQSLLLKTCWWIVAQFLVVRCLSFRSCPGHQDSWQLLGSVSRNTGKKRLILNSKAGSGTRKLKESCISLAKSAADPVAATVLDLACAQFPAWSAARVNPAGYVATIMEPVGIVEQHVSVHKGGFSKFLCNTKSHWRR